MKKSISIQAGLLAAVMIFNCSAGFTVHSADNESIGFTFSQPGLRQHEEYVDESEFLSIPGDVIIKSNYVNATGSGYMYNMLNTEDEKIFYDRIFSACQQVHESDGDYLYTPFAYINDLSLSIEKAKEIAWIFHYDHPEFYWMDSSMRISYSDGISFSLFENYQDGSVRQETTDTIETAEEKYILGAMKYDTEYERAKYLFNTLTKNISYEYGNLDQSAASVFLEGKTVCAGYSKAYSFLCNSVGVEAVVLLGYNHAWNAVKLSDTWYLVDLTNGLFLYSDAEMLKSDVLSDALFQMIYTSCDGEEIIFDYYMHEYDKFKFPVYHDSFPRCSRSYDGTDGKTAATTTCTTTTSATTITTTSTTTLSSSETTALITTTIFPETMVIAGDLNSDNSVDITDAAFILEIYAKNAAGLSVDINKNQKDAGDINGDGVLDLKDAAMILEYYACQSAGIEINWDIIINNSK